jgi:hypothetical protein
MGYMILQQENFSLKMCYLSALAFLPADEFPGAINELNLHFPKEAIKVTDCCKNNYVQDRTRRYAAVLGLFFFCLVFETKSCYADQADLNS